MKSILLIKRGLNIGGTETLCLRMSNWLVKNNYKVYLLTDSNNNTLLSDFDSKVNIIVYKDNLYNLLLLRNAQSFVDQYGLKDVDYIYAYHPLEMTVALSINRIAPKAKMSIGVYHPNTYVYKRIHFNRIFQKYIIKLFKHLPEENIFFMNKQVLENHKYILGSTFKNSKIWPLPLEIKDYIKEWERTNRIISIGNFKEFKTYNYQMIDVIGQLVDQGYDIVYEIYGEGPLKNKMQERITQLGLENYIKLKGQIDYQDFAITVRRGFVFVGIGTAILDAAISSIPAISTVAYSEKPISLGYVNQLPIYCVGEHIEDYDYKNIKDLIIELYIASQKTYDKIRFDGWSYVVEHNSCEKLMTKFICLLEKTKKVNVFPRKLIFTIYVSLLLSNIRKVIAVRIKSILS